MSWPPLGGKVIVIDRGPICGGMTSRTTAHLAPICDDGLSTLINLRGEETARLFQQSQEAAVARIEQIVAELGIDCNFRRLDAFLFPAMGVEPKEARDQRQEEFEAARKVGAAAELVTGVPLKGFEKAPVLRYPNQATFHPLRYLRGVAKAIRDQGGRIFANSPVISVEELPDGGVRVSTENGGIIEAATRRCRHQFADQRSLSAAYQDVSLSHLCDGFHIASRRPARRALLGYG